MQCKYIVIVPILILSTIFEDAVSEPITITLIGTALAAGGWYKWDTLKEYTVCRLTECCNAEYVPYNLDKLKQSFDQKMFGQPLISELVNIISAHKDAVFDETKQNQKALVVSLHGWSGVGKSYAAGMIAEALYKKGFKSEYVVNFIGKKDFDCTDLVNSRKKLTDTLNKTVKKCKTSLFIFNEIHEMCASALDTLKPMIDHHHAVDGVDYRDSIFIFISNIGSKNISTTLLDLYKQGVQRNDVAFHNFEPLLRRAAYFTGGFEKAGIIAHHLIDFYIPFLPLEQQHIEMCALAEFRRYGIYHPSKKMMADALSVVTYGPSEDQPIFANSGCKRFAKQIPFVIKKNTVENKNKKNEL